MALCYAVRGAIIFGLGQFVSLEKNMCLRLNSSSFQALSSSAPHSWICLHPFLHPLPITHVYLSIISPKSVLFPHPHAPIAVFLSLSIFLPFPISFSRSLHLSVYYHPIFSLVLTHLSSLPHSFISFSIHFFTSSSLAHHPSLSLHYVPISVLFPHPFLHHLPIAVFLSLFISLPSICPLSPHFQLCLQTRLHHPTIPVFLSPMSTSIISLFMYYFPIHLSIILPLLYLFLHPFNHPMTISSSLTHHPSLVLITDL